ncbi:MAG TPA: SDR family oxidoreductase [Rhizomicrobium sp.]|jgi:NAD(P)-dependent dehydrogenase (short-subunit alcohol dehydrogenase family)
MDFDGKKVVVIGGTSGIGHAVARRAQAQGAQIVVASSSPERVAKARQAFSNSVEAHAVDVKDEAQVAAFFAGIGGFDHLVYTAGDWGGAMGGAALDTLDLARAGGVFAVRFWGALAAVKHAHKQMRAGGSITLTDGMVAHRPRKGAAVSTAMAGAIEHLVRGLAVDLAPLRVNAVCPGYIATDIWATLPEDVRKASLRVTERYPVPRAGEPDEAAEAYLMRGGYTTGQVLYVDGGMGLV